MAADGVKENCEPLFIFYDCEAANSQVFTADIIEIAARCYPQVRNTSFESLIYTSQELGKFTLEKCSIKPKDLEGKPTFPSVLRKFFKWTKNLIKRVSLKTGKTYFPVLCAHNGYGFDFPILLSNMKRYEIKEHVLTDINFHFADTFQFCKELQEDHKAKELQEIRLSMDSLFSKFCPGKEFKNRHRAMGDVNAMIDIFSTELFKTAIINHMDYTTSHSLCDWFSKQHSEKEQRILLEEKMAKLDAYTRTVYSKKLFKLHFTYDRLQAIFENCCSYMDFYEALQDHGIDRKTAKYFACQFSGMGLKNQGTEPYCNLPKSTLTDTEEIDYSLDNIDLLMTKEETERPPNVRALPIVNEPTSFESAENWESELDESRCFTFTVPKPVVAFSLTVDDFVSNSPPKQPQGSDHNSTKSLKKNVKSKGNDKMLRKTQEKNNKHKDFKDTTSSGKPEVTKKIFRKKSDPSGVFRNGTSARKNRKLKEHCKSTNVVHGEQKNLERKTSTSESNHDDSTLPPKGDREEAANIGAKYGEKKPDEKKNNVDEEKTSEQLKQVAEQNNEAIKYTDEQFSTGLVENKTISECVNAEEDSKMSEQEKFVETTDILQQKCIQQQENPDQHKNILQRESKTFVEKMKHKKNNSKVKRSKPSHEPVIFPNRKFEEQKNWEKVEIFVGDFPIYVYVELNINEQEEEPDVNTELMQTAPDTAEKSNVRIEDLNTIHCVNNNDTLERKDSSEEFELQPCENKAVSSTTDVSEENVSSNLQIKRNSDEEQTTLHPKVKTTVNTTDRSQQTEFDVDSGNSERIKQLVDQEQQTECALFSTFNIKTSRVNMQDKETLTYLPRRAQSTDTVSSYGDNLSDSYDTSPSSPVVPFDSQYEISNEAINRWEYENPTRAFDISISRHDEDNDMNYPEGNNLDVHYQDEDNLYSSEMTRYEVPSPEDNCEHDASYFRNKCESRADVYQPSSNYQNVIPQRYPAHPYPSLPPPIFPPHPNNVAGPPPLFHQRFPHLPQGIPRNASNIQLPYRHGPYNF